MVGEGRPDGVDRGAAGPRLERFGDDRCGHRIDHEHAVDPEPIEVRGGDHVRLASFDRFNGLAQSFAVRQRGSAAYVQLLGDVQEAQAVPFAGCSDAVALLAG